MIQNPESIQNQIGLNASQVDSQTDGVEWRGVNQDHGRRLELEQEQVQEQNGSHGDGAAGVVLLVLRGDILSRRDVQAASW